MEEVYYTCGKRVTTKKISLYVLADWKLLPRTHRPNPIQQGEESPVHLRRHDVEGISTIKRL